jgi:hypothetical protein
MTYAETCLTILTMCALYHIEGKMKKFKILIETLILSVIVGWVSTGALSELLQ